MRIIINNMTNTPKDLRAMLNKSAAAVSRMAVVSRLNKEAKEWRTLARDLDENRAIEKRNAERLEAHAQAAMADAEIAAAIGATITEDEGAE